jgi:pimeloyl-ACP methyl ester carboxylesterase
MKTSRIKGGGGTELHVVETGDPAGHPILFIHGFSQSWQSWARQLNSDLADDHRLVAMDLRGHGQSEKPIEGYADSKLWADDVNAVIESLELERPTLSGWSYGPLLILDYIRYYGEDAISGINFVGGITKLGSDEAMSVIAPEFADLIPGFFSDDPEANESSLKSLLLLCFEREPSAEELEEMAARSMSVPTYVRQALFSRSFDNDDLMPKIRKPVLITHGARDKIVRRSVVDQIKAAIPHAQIQIVEEGGHAVFWDEPTAFNRGLRTFCERNQSEASLTAQPSR